MLPFVMRISRLALSRTYSALPAVRPASIDLSDSTVDAPLNSTRDVVGRRPEKTELSAEDAEIYEKIREIACKTNLESPRLFASFEVGRPLVGELAPIRKREHKWVPPLQARDMPMYEKTKNQRLSTNVLAWHMRKHDFTMRGLRLWLKRRDLRLLREDQTYSTERVGVLGPELAAAHFLVYRGARVKFVGVDKWYSLKDGNARSMPNRLLQQARVEAIDATGLPLMYEGMDHFIGLRSLRYLSLKDCPNIDDWCLPKLFILNKTLEFLDLSGCKKITERGLACLYHLSSLRTLVIGNMPKVENKEMTALLLEDELPLCEIEGVEYNQPPVYLSSPQHTALEEAQKEHSETSEEELKTRSQM